MSPPLGLCLLAQSLWRESNGLDNWHLTMLPLSELCEFSPRLVRDNLSASLWIIGRFSQPEKKKQHEYICMYACARVCVHAYTHASKSVSMHVCLSALMRLLWYCPIFAVRRITTYTNRLYAKTQFTTKCNIYKYVCVSQWLPVAKSAFPTCLLTCICCFVVICVIDGRGCFYVSGICVLCI